MFITFEGIEGSGKGTALERLRLHLEAQGYRLTCTREPGGSALGRTLRGILLDARNAIAPEAELFLYLADRAQHVAEVLRPSLAQGNIVISDRYADSNIVYQGYGRELDVELLYSLNDSAVAGLWPDLTLLLDVDERIGLERARCRNASLGIQVSEGRFEAESLAFHKRVRDGYLAWARRHAGRFAVIDASQSPDAVFADVRQAVEARLQQRQHAGS